MPYKTYKYQNGDLVLFDLDQTVADTSHSMKWHPDGNQDIAAFRTRNRDKDELLHGSDALEAWYVTPQHARGILTSRILCRHERRALRRLGLMQASLFLSRPEGSPLACAVLKSNHIARLLRKPNKYERIVYFEDSLACIRAVALACKTFGTPFQGYHVVQGVALDYNAITA